MKKEWIIIAIIGLFLTMTYGSFGARKSSLAPNCTTTLCNGNDLSRFLKYHVEHSPHRLTEDGKPDGISFYYAYFFRMNGEKYVTMWWSPDESYLDVLKKNNPMGKITARYLPKGDYHFIIVTDKDFEDADLLYPCSSQFLDMENLPEIDVINDGSVIFAKTYKYEKKNDEYKFERQSEYYIDFLGKQIVDYQGAALKRLQEEYPNAKF